MDSNKVGHRHVHVAGRPSHEGVVRPMRQVAHADDKWKAMFEHAPVGIVEIDRAGTIIEANPAVATMFETSVAELRGLSLDDFVRPQAPASFSSSSSSFVDGTDLEPGSERRFVSARGKTGIVAVRQAQLEGSPGGGSNQLLHLMDVTVARSHQVRLNGLARFASLIEHCFDAITVTTRSGEVVYANPPLAAIFGVSPESILGVKVVDSVHPEDRARVTDLIAEVVSKTGSSATFQCRVRHASGSWRHIEIVVTNRLGDDGINGVVSNLRDITDQVDIAAQMAHQAMHDSVTGLPNRTLFADRVDHALARSTQARRQCALLYLDIDRFKQINDNFGHATGDRVLSMVATRLRGAVRVVDTVARLGGDEFVVLIEDIDSPEAAMEVSERIRQAVSRPGLLDGRRINLTCSVGVALASRRRPDELLQEADMALHWAKQGGRNCSELYDRAMRVLSRRRLDTEDVIRTALDEDRVVVHYQPVVDLQSGAVVGTEALARLRLPSGKLLQPGHFIAVAEESGLIVELGSNVLRQACFQQGKWAATGDSSHLAVNVSARQLASEGFGAELAELLEETGLSPRSLCLELTESILIDASPATRALMQELKESGVRFALDDFGTGWSSLAYLRRFPIDVVKIDRSFVSGLGTVKDDTEVVRAVIGLGQSLGLTTVAEGVETDTQAAMLRDMGCSQAQGYLYSRPMPATKRPAIRRLPLQPGGSPRPVS